MRKRNAKPVYKRCSSCGKDVGIGNFYKSSSSIHADGLSPMCKDCAKMNSLNHETGEIDEAKLKNVLRQMDRPYYKDVVTVAINELRTKKPDIPEDEIRYYGIDILGIYFRMVTGLAYLKSKTYADSEKESFVRKDIPISQKSNSVKHIIANEADRVKIVADDSEFDLTDDIIELFGDGFTKPEYRKMHEKYEKLKKNYALQTNLHQETLATYVRFKVKEEIATANGDVDAAKKWYDAAQNAAANGKLTPKQLSEADLHGGINCFSDIFKAVEQAVEVIPILPRFKYRPNDALDFVIWCYINYARDLQGLPQCEYSDVYKFYDKKKQEYLDQYGDPYGIFDEEPDESIRESIKKFIQLPKDYEDGDAQ